MILFSSRVAGLCVLFGVAPATAILRCGPFPLVFFLSYFFVHGNLFSRGERGRVSFWPLRSVRFGHVSFWGSCVNDLLGSLLQRLLFSAILCFDKHYKPSSKNSSTKLFFPSCFVCSSKRDWIVYGSCSAERVFTTSRRICL